MRTVVRETAFDEDVWTPERKSMVRSTFGSMAKEWKLRSGADRTEALSEAISRVDLSHGFCLELGCGTGSVLQILEERFDQVVGVDLSLEMLMNCTFDSGNLLQGDSNTLPFRSGTVDVCIIVNSLLFPDEIRRILRKDGHLVWVSTNGDRTPIYLSPTEVHSALGDEFYGVTAECGNGIWSCFSRSNHKFLNLF